MKNIVLFALLPALSACGEHDLRGTVSQSPDGKTYLTVVDDNGGQCGPLLLDDKPWPYKIGVPGVVAPGRHSLECGERIDFDIRAGTVFRFDYWGP